MRISTTKSRGAKRAAIGGVIGVIWGLVLALALMLTTLAGLALWFRLKCVGRAGGRGAE